MSEAAKKRQDTVIPLSCKAIVLGKVEDGFLTKGWIVTIKDGQVIAVDSLKGSVPNLPACTMGRAQKAMWEQIREPAPALLLEEKA